MEEPHSLSYFDVTVFRRSQKTATLFAAGRFRALPFPHLVGFGRLSNANAEQQRRTNCCACAAEALPKEPSKASADLNQLCFLSSVTLSLESQRGLAPASPDEDDSLLGKNRKTLFEITRWPCFFRSPVLRRKEEEKIQNASSFFFF